MSRIAVLVNPGSGYGLSKRVWYELKPELELLFDTLEVKISTEVHDLVPMTRQLLSQDPDVFLVIGGDGTLSQALNGIIELDHLVNPRTEIAFFNAGTCGDFIKMFSQQSMNDFLDRLTRRQSVKINIGTVRFQAKKVHYFINAATCGMSGSIVISLERHSWLKKCFGSLSYLLYTLFNIFTYSNADVRITVEDNPSYECKLLMMAVCNGQFFGGHMHVAPKAKIDDDLLDVLFFRNFTKLKALFQLHTIYTARHVLNKNIQYIQAKKVAVESINNKVIQVEADGESIGQLPATFELLADKLSVIV